MYSKVYQCVFECLSESPCYWMTSFIMVKKGVLKLMEWEELDWNYSNQSHRYTQSLKYHTGTPSASVCPRAALKEVLAAETEERTQRPR